MTYESNRISNQQKPTSDVFDAVAHIGEDGSTLTLLKLCANSEAIGSKGYDKKLVLSVRMTLSLIHI